MSVDGADDFVGIFLITFIWILQFDISFEFIAEFKTEIGTI